jgi:elongation factor P
MTLASELRAGMALRLEGQIYKVLEVESKAGAAKMGGVVKAKLQNATSGRLWEPHFRPDLRLEDIELEQQAMEFLYSGGGACTFMNPETFEQVEVPAELVGPAERFLEPGARLPVEFFEGRAISVAAPATATARVAETAPPIHSGQDSAWKEARLENGLAVQVPLFIAPGETIRIDVRSVRYLERVRSERKKGA